MELPTTVPLQLSAAFGAFGVGNGTWMFNGPRTTTSTSTSTAVRATTRTRHRRIPIQILVMTSTDGQGRLLPSGLRPSVGTSCQTLVMAQLQPAENCPCSAAKRLVSPCRTFATPQLLQI